MTLFAPNVSLHDGKDKYDDAGDININGLNREGFLFYLK